MNKGFQIEIQSNLSEDELTTAKQFADNFIDYALQNDMKFKYGSNGGWHSYLRRKCLGYEIPNTNLVFRRISTKRRIFGIVNEGTLVVHNDKDTFGKISVRDVFEDGTELNTIKMCKCSRHRADIKVTWKAGLKPEMNIYSTHGCIKG